MSPDIAKCFLGRRNHPRVRTIDLSKLLVVTILKSLCCSKISWCSFFPIPHVNLQDILPSCLNRLQGFYYQLIWIKPQRRKSLTVQNTSLVFTFCFVKNNGKLLQQFCLFTHKKKSQIAHTQDPS